MKLDVIKLDAKKAGSIDLDDEIFGLEPRADILHRVVRWQRAKAQAGTHSVLGKSDVSYSTKKIYRQKGTGGARHGSRRANVFKGGGQTFGPKPRNYAFHVNKKVMASALRTALTLRAQSGDLVVIRDLSLPEIKTKLLAQALGKIGAPKALVVDAGENKNVRMSARNLADSSFLDVRGINVYDILRFPRLLISETSLRAIEARLNKPAKATEAAA